MLDKPMLDRFKKQGAMLANRVKKRFKHLHKRFARQNIDVFRLYDGDIPEIRAVVDWYAGHLVMAEYVRRQSVPEWLSLMGDAVARVLDIPADHVHLKQRQVGKKDGKRYERIAHTDQKIVLNERELKFYVNLHDYVDTGLFSDHRNTRQMVREMAAGKDILNLYCYTGTFSCYAAKGGARTTVSVDRSHTAITWARENMALNGIPEKGNTLVQSGTLAYLEKAQRSCQTFDLAIVDPPSYSTDRAGNRDFDIARDHPILLASVAKVMRPGATILFSTNHQKFDLRVDGLDITGGEEITQHTIPEDYQSKKKTIHRCWKMTV